MSKFFILAFILLTGRGALFSQITESPIVGVAFYNVENFFDTIHDPGKQDEDFLPTSAYHYNSAVYQEKLSHISEVIASISSEACDNRLGLVGLAEIENDRVLNDLVHQEAIDSLHFKFVHFDSPDARGIDVALLYNPQYFRVLHSTPVTVSLYNTDGSIKPTRDILWVYGTLLNEPVHILVNHWPSRRNGKDESSHFRAAAAGICKHLTDSLMNADPHVQIVLMGDLNDNPSDSSVAIVLNTKEKPDATSGHLYNPWYSIYREGKGTLEYNDNWNLFDQIIFSNSFITTPIHGLHLLESHIFNRDFLITHSGRFKGYPHRSYAGKYYIHGYSDHFPVYSIIEKQ